MPTWHALAAGNVIGMGFLFGRPRNRLQPQHKDFSQHGRAPWFLWRFLGGAAVAISEVWHRPRN
jgi:hypothetical protein